MIRKYIMPGAYRDAVACLLRVAKEYSIEYDETYSNRALLMYDARAERHAVLWLELDDTMPLWHVVLVTGRHVTGKYDTEDVSLIEGLLWALDVEPHRLV